MFETKDVSSHGQHAQSVVKQPGGEPSNCPSWAVILPLDNSSPFEDQWSNLAAQAKDCVTRVSIHCDLILQNLRNKLGQNRGDDHVKWRIFRVSAIRDKDNSSQPCKPAIKAKNGILTVFGNVSTRYANRIQVSINSYMLLNVVCIII